MRPSSLAHSWLALLLLAPGCYLHHERPGAGAPGTEDVAEPLPGSLAPPALEPTPPPPECTRRVRDVDLGAVPVDMLFVVDNSGSMREEQAALRAQFPQLIRVLTTGDRDGDGVQDFPPPGDLHLGVVSTDMGLVGISGIPQCEGLGDDGILQNVPGRDVVGCQSSYPRFLSYVAGVDTPETAALDFSCIAALGTDGCGFEQQLESALKALWPQQYLDPRTGELADNPITFLGDVQGFGHFGHGDGENAGFLRNDPASPSLIAIIVVSDEEDCSSADTRHFTPEAFLPEGDPLREQDLNLRCFFNSDNLFPLERYANAFRALRPGAEYLIFFAAIVGVPPDLVDADARARVDFHDPEARDRHYQAILDDPRMEERPDPARTAEQGGNLIPSCETPSGRAFPPRRFVELARQLGDNTVVQSICQEDFRPAIEAILGRLGETIRVASCARGAR